MVLLLMGFIELYCVSLDFWAFYFSVSCSERYMFLIKTISELELIYSFNCIHQALLQLL